MSEATDVAAIPACASCGEPAQVGKGLSRWSVWCNTPSCPTTSADDRETVIARWNAMDGLAAKAMLESPQFQQEKSND